MTAQYSSSVSNICYNSMCLVNAVTVVWFQGFVSSLERRKPNKNFKLKFKK